MMHINIRLEIIAYVNIDLVAWMLLVRQKLTSVSRVAYVPVMIHTGIISQLKTDLTSQN